MPVLDTNLLIRIDAADAVAVATLERLRTAGAPLLLPAVAAAEYIQGMADPLAALAALHRSFHVAHTNDDVLVEAATLRAQAGAKGNRASLADALIAAHAVLQGTFVVTTNKRDFTALGVPAWNYEGEKAPPPS